MKTETENLPGAGQMPSGQNYVSGKGIRIHVENGTHYFNTEDIQRVLCEEIAKLPKETRPAVRAAEDAREIMTTLLKGIGEEFEKFKADAKRYLEDIRLTRFSIVQETTEITSPLKDVRKFFLGNEYKEEIERLREFVSLCERLNQLKASGFLDSVADTMLKLAASE